ncbi:MAG: hypothetical protein JWR80_7975 [Bradyrhizobium sp.]|nr:hypothetical protein [Bradyrhizobium sp.]
MQPITSDNYRAHQADTATRIASGALSLDALFAPPPVRARNVKEEMIQFFLGHPGCTRADMVEHFSDRQIDRYAEESRVEAGKRWRGNH